MNDLVKKLRKSPKAVAQFVMIYNNLCNSCKGKSHAKVQSRGVTSLKYDDFCGSCKNIAEPRLARIREILK